MESRDTLTVPGTANGLAEAMASLEAWTGGLDLAPETRRRVLTALDVVLSNVVRHGFRDQAGVMSVTRSCDAARLSVAVADNAPAFNPLLVPPPDVTLPVDVRPPGGLGVALVRALSDDATYLRTEGQNVLTLHWRLHHPHTGLSHGHS